VAVVQMRRSDLSSKTGEEKEFGRLVVKGHPAVDGASVLDVRPDEVASLKTVDDLIELEYTEPGGQSPKTLQVMRKDFDALAPDMAKVIRNAPQRPGRRSRTES